MMIAVWILISPWVLVQLSAAPAVSHPISGAALSNFVIVGVIMLVVSVAPPTASTVWEGRAYAAMGVWLVASPWVLGFSSDSLLSWNAVVVGILAVAVSGLIGGPSRKIGPE